MAGRTSATSSQFKFFITSPQKTPSLDKDKDKKTEETFPQLERKDSVNLSDESKYLETLPALWEKLGIIPLPPSPFYSMMTDRDISLEKLKIVPIQEFLAAIKKEPQNSILYLNLARVLPKDENIRLLDGTDVTDFDLFSIALILLDPDALSYLVATIVKPCFEQWGEKKSEKASSSSSQEPIISSLPKSPFYSLMITRCILPSELKKIPLGEFLAAIEREPDNPFLYINLAWALPPQTSIRLLDETTMTSQQLFLRASKLGPMEVHFYCMGVLVADKIMKYLHQFISIEAASLTAQKPDASSLPKSPFYSLMTDRNISLKKLNIVPFGEFAAAIAREPRNASLYFNLGRTLPINTSLLLNGTLMNRQQLFCKAHLLSFV